MSFIADYELAFRLTAFAAIFAAAALWESRRPRRILRFPRLRRRALNIGLGAGNSILLRLLFPLLAVETALLARDNDFGLMVWGNLAGLPAWIITLLAFDLLLYGQHRLMHKVPFLWRLHSPHHADPDIDASTALRFHPLEILLSMVFKIILAALLAPPAAAIILFEVLLNGGALFSHANAALPPKYDYCLRWIFVTPSMHHIHHSQDGREMNRNYGFLLSCWDRLFASYHARPQMPAVIGLAYAAPAKAWNPLYILAMPFRPPNL